MRKDSSVANTGPPCCKTTLPYRKGKLTLWGTLKHCANFAYKGASLDPSSQRERMALSTSGRSFIPRRIQPPTTENQERRNRRRKCPSARLIQIQNYGKGVSQGRGSVSERAKSILWSHLHRSNWHPCLIANKRYKLLRSSKQPPGHKRRREAGRKSELERAKSM